VNRHTKSIDSSNLCYRRWILWSCPMTDNPRTRRILLLSILSIFFLASCIPGYASPRAASTTAPQSTATSSASKPQADVPTSGYVGSETCKTCHADMPTKDFYSNYEASPHFVTTLETKKGPEWQGCEACHGPGAAHVASGDKTKIFTFKDVSTKEIDNRCMKCHAGGTEHMNAINSIHTQNDVSCISCHSPHHAQARELLLIKAQPELCYGCHLAKKAEFDMPFHHRVNERLIQCTDCHNPHGTERPKQVRTSSAQDQVCFKCHTDKQGPFVYEHAPVKVDGCESCHMVHGGPNAHMLKLSNVNLLCLQCHTTSSFSSAPGAPSFHNQASLFQSCVLCHSQIHGSNFDVTFFK
jgi:DmsE family decaheme c-type cytochrome